MTTTDTPTNYTKSPYCDAFPEMTDQEFEDLKASIDNDFLNVEVFVHRDKPTEILDGWHRLAACNDLDILPDIVVVDDDPSEFVWRANMARRHLKPGDRARAMHSLNEMRIAQGLEPWGVREMARQADVSHPTILANDPARQQKESEDDLYSGRNLPPQSEADDYDEPEEDGDLGEDADPLNPMGPIKSRRMSQREKEQEMRDTLRRNTDLEEQVRVLEEAASEETAGEMLTFKNLQHEVKALRNVNESLQADNDRLRNENNILTERVKELVNERDGLKSQLARRQDEDTLASLSE